MKKFSLLMLVFVVMFMSFLPISHAEKFNADDKFKVENIGTRNKIIETEESIANNKKERIIQYGVNVTNNIKADINRISGSVVDKESDEVFVLDGDMKQIHENNLKVLYEGKVTNSENMYFVADLEKQGKKYNATITITDSSSSFGATFTFDGKKSFKVKDSKEVMSVNEYYENVKTYNGNYYSFKIQGPKTILRGSDGTYKMRMITDTSAVHDYWKNKGENTDGAYTTVVDFNSSFGQESGAIYSAVNPHEDGSNDFSFMFHFGPYIGLQKLSINNSTQTVIGDDEAELTLKTSWSDDYMYCYQEDCSNVNSGPSYRDDTSFNEDPQSGRGFGYKWDIKTNKTTFSAGDHYFPIDVYVRYWTHIDTWYGYSSKFLEVTTPTQNYKIVGED
jgi:hypothetical protein